MNDNDITSSDALIAELRAALDDALNILVTYRHAGERHSVERINRTSAAILRGIGTDEPLIEEDHGRMFRPDAVSISWRRQLRLDEINQMGQTPEVRARPGRP